MVMGKKKSRKNNKLRKLEPLIPLGGVARDQGKKFKPCLYTTRYGEIVPELMTELAVKDLANTILRSAKKGQTMDMILTVLNIPTSLWIKNYKKHQILRYAVEDAAGFHKAYGQKKLQDMATGKKNHSPQIAKIWFASFYDITEEYKAPKETNNKADKYTVVTKMDKSGVPAPEVANGKE